jgi:hypothetical protein
MFNAIEVAYLTVFSNMTLTLCSWVLSIILLSWGFKAARNRSSMAKILAEFQRDKEAGDRQRNIDPCAGFQDLACHVDFKALGAVSIERAVEDEDGGGRKEYTVVGYIEQDSKRMETWWLGVSRDQHLKLADQFKAYLDSKSSKITA